MIYLTKRDEDKTKFLVNQSQIFMVYDGLNGSNVHMSNGRILTVVEKEKEIQELVDRYMVDIIKTAIQEAKKE